MRFDIDGGGSGKTTRALRWVKEWPTRVLVVANRQVRASLLKANPDIPGFQITTFEDAKAGLHPRLQVWVDDVEGFLRFITGVHVIGVNGVGAVGSESRVPQ